MPRTAEEILAHADELARRFEAEPDPDRIRDATTLRELARAFERRARAEAALTSAVTTARADGHTWAAIGAMLGTSGEAARQRYGPSGGRKSDSGGQGKPAGSSLTGADTADKPPPHGRRASRRRRSHADAQS